MAFIVVYDACERILDECFESILDRRPDLAAGALDRTRQLMGEAVADCLVTGYEPLEAALSLPDPDDRHVLAAAIRANAQVIVTFNLSDFPATALASYDIEAKHPDDFLLDSLDLAPGVLVRCLTEQAGALKHPARTVPEVLNSLRDLGLVRTVARFGELLGKEIESE